MKKLIAGLLSLTLCLTLAISVWAEEKELPEPVTETDKVDIDLSKVSQTIVYPQVYYIIAEPEKYLGQTIRVQGAFEAYDSWDGLSHNYYLVVTDSTSCCSQGLEFIWRGEHAYPEDYPKDYSWIEIGGRLDTYVENGFTFYYIDAGYLNPAQYRR